MFSPQQLMSNAGLRQVCLGQDSAAKRSKIKKWTDFKLQFNLDSLSYIDHSHLLDYGIYLWDHHKISSACSYVSAAHQHELSRRPSKFSSSQKDVDRVYHRIQQEVESPGHKCPPNLIPTDIPFMLMSDLSIVCFMGALGIRPICAENLKSSFTPIYAQGSQWISALRLESTHDKAQAMKSRFLHYVCTCEHAPQFCCIHRLGVPQLPLTRQRLLQAFRSLNQDCDRNYGSRRQHCLGVCRLISFNLSRPVSSWYRSKVKERINAQLGWVRNSSQFENYCKDSSDFENAGCDLWGVSSGVVTYYLHGKFPVFE